MTDFLDRLAMEVGEWGGALSDRKTWTWVRSNINGGLIAFCDGGAFTKDQWLQRRKELINEPDDADAPVWASFKAQDADGEWFWYSGEPARESRIWSNFKESGKSRSASDGKIPAGHYWGETLKEVKRETKVEAEEVTDPLESEVIRTIAMIRVETDEYVRFSLVDHFDVLLEAVRNKLLDSVEGGVRSLTQQKIQSVIDRGQYRKMKDATVLVNEKGHAAIVNYGGAFYWVDNEALTREWSLAGEAQRD